MAAVQGDLAMAERVKKFDVHANQIIDWKKRLLSNASDVFDKGAQKAEAAGRNRRAAACQDRPADDGE